MLKVSATLTFSAGKGKVLLFFFTCRALGTATLVSQVSAEANKVKVFLDVVHDFGFEESLCSIVHDLVTELGFGNVLTQLFDTSSQRSGSILIDDFVAFTFGGLNEKKTIFCIRWSQMVVSRKKRYLRRRPCQERRRAL